ncbi:MAG: YbaK/EbsC family protein [Candidatus Saccharimonadales bacterium]|jgi:Ala-tRNA(Pro) deacylase
MNPYESIINTLKTYSVNYSELEHEPVYTSEQAAKVRGLSIDTGAKSLLLKANDNYYLVVLSGSKKIDSKKFKMAIGIKKFRFATPDEVKEKMLCNIGACYPFGSIVKLDTYIDKSLIGQSIISFNPGRHDKSIKMDLKDYMMIENPKQIDISISSN